MGNAPKGTILNMSFGTKGFRGGRRRVVKNRIERCMHTAQICISRVAQKRCSSMFHTASFFFFLVTIHFHHHCVRFLGFPPNLKHFYWHCNFCLPRESINHQAEVKLTYQRSPSPSFLYGFLCECVQPEEGGCAECGRVCTTWNTFYCLLLLLHGKPSREAQNSRSNFYQSYNHGAHAGNPFM